MPDVDLSNYAGLFMFGIFSINIVLALWGYKMNGIESAIASGALAVIGMWIGLGIVNAMDFDDATPETVLTIGVFSILFSSIYTTYVFTKWLSEQKVLKIQQKLNGYQNELINLQKSMGERSSILHLIQLIKCCGCDTIFFEKHGELADMSRINDAIEKKKVQINDVSSQ